MKITLEYSSKVLKIDIPQLSFPIQKEIKRAIEKKLLNNPIAFSKPLLHELKAYRSLRVGDYRVVFLIDMLEIDVGVITIISIGHRNKIYDITLERLH